MPSHFGAIGLPVESAEEIERLLDRVVDKCESLDVEGGRYLYWSASSGAELWIQVDADGNYIGLNPHFWGKSRFRARIDRLLVRSDFTQLDGSYLIRLVGDELGLDGLPIVFDVPDFKLHHRSLPEIVTFQLTAFAHDELEIFESEEAFNEAEEEEWKDFEDMKFGLAPDFFFVPSFLLPPDEQPEAPEPFAFFAGFVLEAEKRITRLTGKSFWWASVKTFPGIIDVVIEPTTLTTEPKVGGVLKGYFYLSGRLVIQDQHE